ncbi:MAG: hypothetical protein H0V21_10555 [Rubrobacter sp.]|nr:hypothetical protein [Rubrobacter sp.]
MKIKLSLLVLTFAWVVLVPVPAMSQTGPAAGSAQYDQYDDQGSGVGDRAAHDAITAWGAIHANPEGAQATGENTASAAEVPDESAETSNLEELPETGGPSPLWFGVPLLCAGGLLARRIFSP